MERMDKNFYKNVIEAALFIAPRPLSLTELARIAGIGSLGYAKDIMADLVKEWANKGINIVEINGGWKMVVKPDILKKVAQVSPYTELTEGCKRCLALIIYKEPAKKSEIVKIQGNKAYSYIKELEKAGLIRSEKAGRTAILRLTTQFERYIGAQKDEIKKQMAAILK
jgi:segregation and condensation protein B